MIQGERRIVVTNLLAVRETKISGCIWWIIGIWWKRVCPMIPANKRVKWWLYQFESVLSPW